MVNQAKTKEPTVCAIMLVNGREEMVKRAIKSFREQTYQKKRLLILDTGVEYFDQKWKFVANEYYHLWGQPQTRGPYSIGELRNQAATEYPTDDNIICHWDSDDWSHPRRIEEQVALLQASGKSCVGYKDCLFWDTTPGQFCGAWLYRHPTKPLGTSLMYWRSVWEQRPFPDLPKVKGGTGEDVQWLEGVNHIAVESFRKNPPDDLLKKLADGADYNPRMIASIHGGNTQFYNPAESERLSEGTSWKRAAEWDAHCQKVMVP